MRLNGQAGRDAEVPDHPGTGFDEPCDGHLGVGTTLRKNGRPSLICLARQNHTNRGARLDVTPPLLALCSADVDEHRRPVP